MMFLQVLVRVGAIYFTDMQSGATPQEEDFYHAMHDASGLFDKSVASYDFLPEYVRWCIRLRNKGKGK